MILPLQVKESNRCTKLRTQCRYIILDAVLRIKRYGIEIVMFLA